MRAKTKPKNSWFTVLLIIAAVAVWAYNGSHRSENPRAPATSQSSPEKGSSPPEAPEKAGAYEIHSNCTLVDARNNDGDSFRVKLSNGKTPEFRLYFVDTPESAFKSYAGGDTNHERIRQQAADLGGISAEQAVEIGKEAKHFTLGLLAARPFGIYTRWDSPFHDKRYHAFIRVKQDGKARWLHEILVEKGMARIHTKGADMPDGTTTGQQKARLKQLEAAAKRQEAGVWGL